MRVFSALLVTSVAVLTCITAASETSEQKPMTRNQSASARSAAGDHSADPANRSPRDSDTGDEEARAVLPLLATTTFKPLPAMQHALSQGKAAVSESEKLRVMVEDNLATFSKSLPSRYDFEAKRIGEQRAKLKALGVAEKDRYCRDVILDGNARPGIIKAVGDLVSADDRVSTIAINVMGQEIHAHEVERRAQEAAAKFGETARRWIDNGKSIKDVFTLLQLEEEGGFIFATVELEVLMMFVKAFNEKHGTNFGLLDALVIGFEDEGKVARILSFASSNPVYKARANTLQKELFGRWLHHGIPEDGVFVILGLDEPEKIITYEDVDTITKYVDMLIDKHLTTKPNAYEVLKANLGDRKFAKHLSAAIMAGQESEKHMGSLLRDWFNQGILPEDLYARFFNEGSPDKHNVLALNEESPSEVLEVNKVLSLYHKHHRQHSGEPIHRLPIPPSS
ncbi:unnamed protein product [Hyaloperonospora brassicae]|uniref:RxLR effector candidate protein n=1 Tax=Hyaloperonospora brassicae TaxID=162125 RepID=A0AAV0U456_HYABA|nr:unnamed protein product [Hyaloperonospora brassicae]